MEPSSNYLRRRGFLLLLLLFTLVNAIACGSGDNEPGLKFTNLSAARVSGLRGKSLQLFCGGQDARGEQLKYEWLFNGSPIKDNDFRFAHKANGTVLEVRKLYLVMKNASKSTGRYNCLLSNSNGSILSRNIFLISTTRTKSSNKKNEVYKKIRIGENIRLFCPALSLTNDVWFSWLFNNEPLQETRTAYTLINSSVLHIVSATKSNEGTYTCIAHSQNSTAILKSFLRVTNAEDDYKYLHFLSENKTVTNALNGQMVTLECLVNLARPDATVHWRRASNRNFFLSNTKEGGNELALANRRKVSRKRLISSQHVNSNDFDEDEMENLIDSSLLAAKKRYSIVGESSLQIENVNPSDEDDYICTASYTLDEFNITDSTVQRLNVLDPPLQVKPPKETKLEAFASKKAKFDCGLIYLPKGSSTSIANRPTIRWLKNGLPLEPSSRVYTKKDLSEHLNDDEHEKEEILFEGRHIKLDDLVSSQLVISSTIRSDSGYYQCFIESQYESLTNEFYLYVNPINNQPLPPRNLMVNIIGSSEAIVNWSVPMSLSEILGYTVHYQSVSSKMKIREEKAVTNNNFYHLTNLSPYTNYTLFVRAYSQQNASNDSKVITFLTGEETPVDLPFFRVSVKNKTTALLKWEELSSVDARGKILYYKIQYAEVPNVNEETKPELIKTINVEAEATEYPITGLQPGHIYRFKVIAGNSKGLPADDIVDYVDWEQIEMPLINGDQIRLNLNASALGDDAIRVDWKVEEEGNEKDITPLLKKHIKLVCQNTFRDEDRQVFEVKRDQTSFEFVDLFESQPYMIEIEVQFEKGGLQFKESTLVKTLAKTVIPKLLPDPALDNDLDQTETGSSSQPSVEPSNSIDSSSDVLASSTSSAGSTSSSTTPEPISSSTAEPSSMSGSTSSSTTESINRADIDFDPSNEVPNGNLTGKPPANEKNEENKFDLNSYSSPPSAPGIDPSAYNISENLLDDVKPTKKLAVAEEEDPRNDLNPFEKKAVYEGDKDINLNSTDERHPANRTAEDEETQRKLLIDSKNLDKFNATRPTEQAGSEQTGNERHNESDFNVQANGINSTDQNATNSEGTSTTETIPAVDRPTIGNEINGDPASNILVSGNSVIDSNQVIGNKSIEQTSSSPSPVDSNELSKKQEESIDNPNISVNQINDNDLRKPFLKRLDKEATRSESGEQPVDSKPIESNPESPLPTRENGTNPESGNKTSETNESPVVIRKNENANVSSHDLVTDLKREEDRLMNSLDQQDNQLKSKLDLFDSTHRQAESSSTAEPNGFPSSSSTTSTSTTSTPSSSTTTSTTTAQPPSTAQSIAAELEMQNRINQILKRNLTKDDLLPNISEFEVVPLNGSTVNCRWTTNSLNENATFTVYYNPIRYLDSNYSKNFEFDDEFLFVRTTSTEVNITNLQPHTIYDFYITINYKSNDADEDFFYQLNKFLAKKLKNRFYVKHTKTALNATEKPFKLQALTKTQKKYEKPFRALESVIDEFENLLAFFKGQRRRVRTLEELPGPPAEFTGIALDASSVQLSWRSPIEPNGVIQAFELYYTRKDQHNLTLDEWTAVALEGNQFVHIVKSLNESTEYQFLVRARNGAGLGKSTPKLIICTLKENYDTQEKFLAPEQDLIGTNTYTKYDMSVKDYLSLDESNELLIRIGIGVSVLFACVVVLAVFSNKICTPVKRCKCKQHPKGNCPIQMNNYGFKRNRNADYLNGLNGLRVPLSNSNQNVLIYSRQSSNNQIDSSSPSTSNPSVQSPTSRHSVNICNNMLQQVNMQQVKEPTVGNRSNVLVEVHSPSEPTENSDSNGERLNNPTANNNRHLTFTRNPQIINDEITPLNGTAYELNGRANGRMNGDRRHSTSSEENSLNDQNLNCQLQVRRKSSLPNGQAETELNDKTKRLRRYSEKDKELNLPLLNSNVYHEYDQPENLVPITQSMNCCQNHPSNSLNIRKTSCNCNQRAMNGFNKTLNNVENGDDDERRSLV